MNVSPLVVPDAQATKLIQPGKRTLHDSAPSAETTAMFRAAHGEQRQNVAGAHTLTNDLRVIRAVAEHAVRTAPRSPSLALERRNRIDERQRFFRVMPVGTGQANGERYAPPVADQVTFTASLGSITMLSLNVGRTIINETSLNGLFDVDLEWSPDQSVTDKPSLFTALQEQLGLNLESTRRPVEVLVIDHIERPTPD